MPLLTLVLLGIYWRRERRDAVSHIAWVALLLASYYGVSLTHDYFALLASQKFQATILEQRGVSRTEIMGGFEYDFWTQITVAGHINDPRIINPPGTYYPAAHPPFATKYPLWQYTPVISPRYVITMQRVSILGNDALPPRPFVCWLPPFRREVFVQAVITPLQSPTGRTSMP